MEPSPTPISEVSVTPPVEDLRSPEKVKTSGFEKLRTGQTPAPPSIYRIRRLVDNRDEQFQRDIYQIHKNICHELFERFDPNYSEDRYIDYLITGFFNSELYAEKVMNGYNQHYGTGELYLEVVKGYSGRMAKFHICINPNPTLCQSLKRKWEDLWTTENDDEEVTVEFIPVKRQKNLTPKY